LKLIGTIAKLPVYQNQRMTFKTNQHVKQKIAIHLYKFNRWNENCL